MPPRKGTRPRKRKHAQWPYARRQDTKRGAKSFTRDKVESFFKALAIGTSARSACHAAGINYDTMRGWIKRARGQSGGGPIGAAGEDFEWFADEYDRIRGLVERDLVADLRMAASARAVKTETVHPDGSVTREYYRADTKAAMWMLARINPQQWGDPALRVEHSGPDGGALEVKHNPVELLTNPAVHALVAEAKEALFTVGDDRPGVITIESGE